MSHNQTSPPRGERSPRAITWRKAKWILAALSIIYVLPLLVALILHLSHGPAVHWSRADRSSAGISPDAGRTPEAVVQAFSARAYGWRGIFGVHTWIAVKPANAYSWDRLEVIGFGVGNGRPAVRISKGVPDGRWFGSNPVLLAELRGAVAESAISSLRAAAAYYPYPNRYVVWPGPNSNTFIAYLARRVPEMHLDLPPNAIGKDYPVDGMVARTPSGTGWQVSLGGILGIVAGQREGVELDVFGLSAGVDLRGPALRLPGVGRLGFR